MKDYIDILENELKWLELLFLIRKEDPFVDICNCTKQQIDEIIDSYAPITWETQGDYIYPKLALSESLYSNLIVGNKIELIERILLILTLSAHLRPDFLYKILNTKNKNGEEFYKNNETGATKGTTFRGIVPTGLTYLYLIAGQNFRKRTEILKTIIKQDFFLLQKNIIKTIFYAENDPILAKQLHIDPFFIKAFITNYYEKK